MGTPGIAVIGGGNMARALVEGGLRAGLMTPSGITVVEPDEARRARCVSSGMGGLARADLLTGRLALDTQIVLAVKPQALDAVARDAASVDLSGRIVISILAGTPSERVRMAFGGDVRVVRAMPNLPAQVGQGCTAVAIGAGAVEGDDAFAVRLFGAVGPVVERVDEMMMDAFTAVAGSGPAYVFYLAEAMARAAVSLGFTADAADRVVRQVIAGSGAMLAAAGDEPFTSMRAAVTSKGGTTEAACRVLDDARIMDAVVRALSAARDRGRELARGSGEG
ncbi:MAG: pyrroline-5-carboxylate reductase [Phycisphaerae bacterium]|nr:pyrroline-5-carboxylate reductase [Phycisphaerae bacterium]